MFRNSYYESDQKDIVIAQLKADIFEAQKQNEELELLQSELNKWEVKIKMADEEKQILEYEQSQKHEQALHQIQAMTQEIKQLSKILKERHLDQERQVIQQKELEEINDQRQAEIQQTRKTFNKITDYVIAETKNIENLQLKLEKFEGESDNAELQNKELNKQLNELIIKNKRVEQDCLILEEKLSKLLQNDMEQEIKNIQQQLGSLNEVIKQEEQDQHVEKQNNKQLEVHLNRMQHDISNNEIELTRSRKQLLVEQQKRDDLNKRKTQLQKILAVKQEQYDQGQIEFEKCKNDNQTIVDENKKFKGNLKQLQNHIEVLLKVNQDLVNELEQYCGEDQKVKQILNRAARVKELQLRVVSGSRLIKK